MRGAYGIALVGLGSDHPSLPAPADGWQQWDITWAAVDGYVPRGSALPVNIGGHLDFLPQDRVCVIATDDPPSLPALAHPWLATIGAWIANERGFETFHAGGVMIDGGLWAVLGQKEAGKSTTLAAFHRAGFTVTSDDLVVLDGGVSLSGPACIDLRRGSAEALGLGVRTSLMSGRERWRIDMPPPPAEVPLAGFIQLSWSRATIDVVAVRGADRLRVLFESRSALWRDDRGLRMLRLAGLPMLEWRRPRSFADLGEHLGVLVEHVRSR